MAQLLRFNRIFYKDESLIEGERLLQKVVSAQLSSANGRLNRAVSGDHDDLGRIIEFTDPLQGFQAVYAGEPDIQQNHVEATPVQQFEASLTSSGHRCLVAFVLQHPLKRLLDRGFVVDDEDGGHD